jgi:hypothetical protein
MEQILREATNRQRVEIARLLHEPMAELAEQCALAWGERGRLNQALIDGYAKIPHRAFLYIMDDKGVQITDKIDQHEVVPGFFGRDRSDRPYMSEAVPEWGFLLSRAYISLTSRHPTITALHVIRSGAGLLGYLAANFDLRDMPITAQLYREPDHWRQVKGDPSIRKLLFQQCRVESPLDKCIERSMSIMEEMLTQRGVFQTVIHFSSSRATIWTLDDPYRYRILDQEALADPDICLAYPHQIYPKDAIIPSSAIAPILGTMQELRIADETVYLRSASINLFNGMVSLTFSCDGSHYMRYDEFLDKSLGFWFGEVASEASE